MAWAGVVARLTGPEVVRWRFLEAVEGARMESTEVAKLLAEAEPATGPAPGKLPERVSDARPTDNGAAEGSFGSSDVFGGVGGDECGDF